MLKNDMRSTLTLAAVHLSTCVVFMVLLHTCSCTLYTGTSDLERQFIAGARERFRAASERSRSTLLNIWHTDCHRRCRWQLVPQVEVACEFDPYKLNRTKRSAVTQDQANETETAEHPLLPILDKTTAMTFLRDKPFGSVPDASSVPRPLRRRKRGVYQECCFHKACSWEEYGEYCHRHARTMNERQNSCSYS